MNITIVTIGSRGDVQPYVALGVGLKSAGHRVRLATHARFESFIKNHSLDFAELPGDPREMVESDAGQAWLDTGTNPLAFARKMAAIMRPLTLSAVRHCLQACRDADLIIYSILGWLVAHHVAEKLYVPTIAAPLQPVTPTPEFHMMGTRSRGVVGRIVNRMMYVGGEQLYWICFRRSLNNARSEILDLPPMPLKAPFSDDRKRGGPVLYGYSPTLLPKPPEWPENVHVTGAWFLDPDPTWKPSRELSAFLEAGPPPVYVGFGSTHTRNAAELTRYVVQALKRTGQRGIILTGWGGLHGSDLPDNVFTVSSVPHDWLFPKTAAVIHHCGSGTTAAGLRAGVPIVPIPFYADQPFWAACMHDLGVAAKPIPIKKLSADRLITAINYVTNDVDMRKRAVAVGERVRSEDGVGRAVELVERLYLGD
ncbi:MAG: glycosyltransferase family 1 protein [Gemmatimonadota bacterium]|nr:MAG: glycosyltransferase family 1 protein [Gemmatimonadota bacterium]